jgi:pimeloyl-ACP methyl ester carboxylesterase
MMNNTPLLRTYGYPPYSVILVHGGPGAGGEMAPVARRLSASLGVIEPIQTETTLDGQVEELRAVVAEAAAMRQDGRPIQLAGQIRCSVTAIHGDYDPHPAEGVRVPLQKAGVPDFRFILLKSCGHTPWNEREAREEFYRVLETECCRK